ncbi:MAG: serine protease [Bacteroidota bacterium]
MKHVLVLSIFLISFIGLSQDKKINPQEIAAQHFNSVVKVIMFDSVAEKLKPGSGYLGRGSGFFVSDDGIIFTNEHVAKFALGVTNYTDYGDTRGKLLKGRKIYEGSDLQEGFHSINYISKVSIIVQVFNDPERNDFSLYTAKLLSIDTSNFDGAILQIVSKINNSGSIHLNTDKFNPVKLGNSDSTSQGEDFISLAFPNNFDGNFSTALSDQSTQLSGKHSGYDFTVNRDYGYIKTDININAGNSGGAVFNSKGLVIGLASAKSEKTDIGFISRINGMYNLAKNDFALLNKLKALGLCSPNKTHNVSGIINNPIVKLPDAKRITIFNENEKQVRKFVGGFWYLKGSYPLVQMDYFTLNQSPSSFIKTDSSSTINVTNKSSYSGELGKTFVLKRSDNYKSKLSLDMSLNLIFMNKDWSKSNLVSDSLSTLPNTDSMYYEIKYNANQQSILFGGKMGLMYSAIINKTILFDIYYKFGVMVYETSSSTSNEIAHYTTKPKNSQITLSGLNYVNTLGFNFNFKYIMLGFEYNLGKSISNVFQGALDKPFTEFDFETNTNVVKQNKVNLEGSYYINNFNVTLGIPIYNKKRWKTIFY